MFVQASPTRVIQLNLAFVWQSESKLNISCLSISSSSIWCFVTALWWNKLGNLSTLTKLNLHCISATIEVFVGGHSESLAAAVYGALQISGEQGISSLYDLQCKDTYARRRCESCQEGNEWLYCFKMVHGARDCTNMSSGTSNKDVILQKCCTKKWMPFLHYAQKRQVK